MRYLLLAAALFLTGISCVSTQKFNTLRAENIRLEAELEATRNNMKNVSSRNDVLMQTKENLETEVDVLRSELAQLRDRYERLLDDGSAEAARMLRQIEQAQKELDQRTARIEELENLLKQREEAIMDIRRKVADALTGFEGEGLSVTTKEGKVYVSMDDKLLFRSGSFDIDPKGAQAVRELARVLAINPDINIMVEGHTDDVPYKGSGQLKDNLDLSVKRATTVVRLLLENKGIDPTRIIAAGRGEYLPLHSGKSPEQRAFNRRTEIILEPKLDELLKIMDR